MPKSKVKIPFIDINLAKYFRLHKYSVNKEPQPRTASRKVERIQIPVHYIHNTTSFFK